MFIRRLLSFLGSSSVIVAPSVSALITCLASSQVKKRKAIQSVDRVGAVRFIRVRTADKPVWVMEGYMLSVWRKEN